MTKQAEFQQRAKSIEELVVRLEQSSDVALKTAAQELVQAVLELHGAGLERMLEAVRGAGDSGRTILDRLAEDELVRSVLLLHGLHPLDLSERVIQTMEELRPFLKKHGASAELVSLDETGVVTVHFRVTAGGCGSTASSVKAHIEAALQDRAPDTASVVVVDKSATPGAGFVPIAELQSGRSAAIHAAPQAQRSGD